jgi:hypothetical protein
MKQSDIPLPRWLTYILLVPKFIDAVSFSWEKIRIGFSILVKFKKLLELENPESFPNIGFER